jgi:2-polyprenyl-3-methyl-5-hydroxy-6-metoxy-1,4-benzoquinol methylase
VAESLLERARTSARWRVHRLVGWKPYPDSVHVDCALCGADDSVVVARRVSFDMRYRTVVCRACGLVYIDPRPTEESFRRFYDNGYFSLYTGKRHIGEAVEPVPDRGTAVFDFVAEDREPSSLRGLLDIGCGVGGLLFGFADSLTAAGADEVRLVGCDPGRSEAAPTEVERAGRMVELRRTPAEELGGDLDAFGLLTMFDVLEHLLEPRKTLAALRQGVRDSTLLFVATSCLDNWRGISPGGFENYYLRLGHPYVFTLKTLERLLAASGWEVVRRTEAAKGDQWVFARASTPDPAAAGSIPGHCDEVLEMIEGYRARCRP